MSRIRQGSAPERRESVRNDAGARGTRYHVVMEIDTLGNVLVGIFELEAAVGLALLAIVIVMLVRSVVEAQHRTHLRASHRNHRSYR